MRALQALIFRILPAGSSCCLEGEMVGYFYVHFMVVEIFRKIKLESAISLLLQLSVLDLAEACCPITQESTS